MLRYADLFPIEFAGGSRSFWDQEMDGLAIPSPYERNLPQFLGPQFMNRSSTFQYIQFDIREVTKSTFWGFHLNVLSLTEVAMGQLTPVVNIDNGNVRAC